MYEWVQKKEYPKVGGVVTKVNVRWGNPTLWMGFDVKAECGWLTTVAAFSISWYAFLERMIDGQKKEEEPLGDQPTFFFYPVLHGQPHDSIQCRSFQWCISGRIWYLSLSCSPDCHGKCLWKVFVIRLSDQMGNVWEGILLYCEERFPVLQIYKNPTHLL